ncbi:MAG TPA: YbaN family protein [Allosphingosinicella sp.]
MMRLVWLFLGGVSVALGVVGAVLPLMPTVPFMLLAAFCFARGHPPFEDWLLNHRTFGPHIRAWRERGAISRRGKYAAALGFAGSAVLGLVFLPMPWALLPAVVAVLGGSWVWSRPD